MLTLTLAFVTLTQLGCGRTNEPVPAELPPDIQLNQVKVREYRGSTTTVVATTPSLGFHREGSLAGHVVAKELVVDTTSGLHVEVHTVQGDALAGQLEGLGVHALSSSGTTFDSPRAWFDRSVGTDGTASTDAGVIVHHPSFVLEAKAGSVDIADEHAELTEVTTHLQ